MSARDFLASIMSPGAAGGGKAPVGADEYQRLLQENMGRVGYDRDQAVRSANIAGGFGNSTAQQFMHGAGGGMPPNPMTTGAVPMPAPDMGGGAPVPVPQPRPDMGGGAPVAGIGSGIPMPEQGIGSGIPMPQLPREPNFDLPAQVSLPDQQRGGITIGAEPALPGQTGAVPTPRPSQYALPDQAPTPTIGSQYRMGKKPKKKPRQ